MIAIYTQRGEIVNLNMIESINIVGDRIIADTPCFDNMGDNNSYTLYTSDDRAELNAVMEKIKYRLSNLAGIISLQEG